ncbi:MAG: disulfide bond formation protein B [Woeseiaceae bacterium]|nr:disulfide bond formation protein B [Woeseiaceae bacterium]
MQAPSKRNINLIGAASCVGMLAFALYSQHVLLLDPCPLCILQRIAVIALGMTFLVAAIHGPQKVASYAYAALSVLLASLGAAIAGWHMHLQNLPADEIPSCGPGLGYMLENFPLVDALNMVFKGSGECAEVSWQFLGLTMPAWVFVTMVCLAVVASWNNLRH